MVVAEHERDRRGLRRIEPCLRLLALGRGWPEQGHALVRPEVEAADDADHYDGERHAHPAEEAADLRRHAALRRRWLAVERHRRQRAGRQNSMAVAVERGSAADSFLESGPH